jgi:cytochrome c-type biogenesis protein CcmH/NrfF
MANSDLDCPDYIGDKKILGRLISEGKSDEEIYAWFVADRGKWCIALPGNEDGNFLGWLLPLVVMLVGGPFVLLKVRGWSRAGAANLPAVGPPVSEMDDESDEVDAHYKKMLDRALEED